MSLAPSVRLRASMMALFALTGGPAALAAQGRLELTPFIGSYYHLTHIAEGSSGPIAGNDFTFDQQNAIALGARINVPVGERFAVQGEFAYARSGVRITEENIGGGIDGGLSADGNIIYGSLRGVISPRRSNLFLLGGPAIIRRGGDAWDGSDGSDITDFGGVVGFGFRANVTPRFRLNFTAETFLYSFDGGGPNSKFQSDILVSLGVPISLSR